MSFKPILVAACLAFALPALADGNYLHIRTANGWEVLDIDKIDRLEFKGGKMTATDASDNVVASYPQETLESMFIDDSAGINNVAVSDDTAQALKFDAASGLVTILTDGDFTVYDADGRTLVSIPGVSAGETVNLSAIRPGVVILVLGNHSLKVAIR